MSDTVLVVAAHPDDEVLGCGGTIAKHAAAGDRVVIAILGEGITSRYERREQADPGLLARLRDCARRAGARLGATEVRLQELPDNRFDTVPLLDIIKRVEEVINDVRPSVVYCQHGGDLNIDHERVFRAVLTGTRPTAGCVVRRVYAFEVGSSTDWAFGQFAPVFRASRFVDVTDTLEQKVAAMEEYDSEARVFPHPRSSEALRARARSLGSVVGLEAAEAFSVVREVVD